jgi:GTP-binding protein HflX
LRVVLLSIREDIKEMLELLRTLDFTLDNVFIQKRETPDTRTYLGKGKLTEIRGYLEGVEADIIVVNDETKPVQRLNLENELGLEVYDRIRIILEIFKERARSEEAKLQVELAALEYEGPWLKELIHKARLGEHPGLMAGGEYQVRQYFTQNTKRERVIKKRLMSIEHDRETKRQHRHREGFVLVAITGYTNAGKSTLFNALTEETVLVDDRMFATLSTTTRRLGAQQPKILLTDTVGFIVNLPPWLVEAFNSTMEEVFESDVVVLVVDGTDAKVEILRKVEACLDVIQTGQKQQIVILALNKSDLPDPPDLKEKEDVLKKYFSQMRPLVISAEERSGLPELAEMLFEAQENILQTVLVELEVPDDDFTPPLVNWLYENAVVKEKSGGCGVFRFKAVVPQRFMSCSMSEPNDPD